MQRLFICVSLICISAIQIELKAQDCSIHPLIQEHYKKDIADLALTFLEHTNASFSDSIRIADKAVQQMAQNMSAIFNLNSPESNAVFKEYCIKNYINRSSNEIILSMNLDCPLYPFWSIGDLYVGHNELDQILNQFGFYAVKEISLGEFVLTTNQVINMQAIIDDLLSFKLFKEVYVQELIGDGNKIYCDFDTDPMRFHFELAWGGCLAGCTHKHEWIFEVNQNCEAKFLSSYGDEISEDLIKDCSLDFINPTIEFDHVPLSIYPNPNNGEFYIDAKLHSNATVYIFNTQGGYLSYEMNGQRLKINDLPSGVYFVQIQEKGKLKTRSKTLVVNK